MEENEPQYLKQRFAISPLLDAEIDVAAAGWVGLTPAVDHELRLSVTAAVIAHFMGLKSIDRVRKKLADDTKVHAPRDQEVRSLFERHMHTYDQFYRSFEPRSNSRLGIFAFDLALVRSRASIELMLVSARQGFLIEPCLMARSLVEQFAYAMQVWQSDEDDVVFGTKPQSSISSLKEVNPNIGKAYGLLSELAHYHPQMHYSFIGQSDENSDVEESSTALQRSYLFKITSLAWVYFILDLKYAVFSSCYGDHDNFSILLPLAGTPLESYDRYFRNVDIPAVSEVRSLFSCA